MRPHSELSRLVGSEHVLEAPPPGSPYNSDASRRRGVEGRAEAVVLPGNPEEVAAVVGWCYAHDVPVVPRGGGTGLTGGAVPTEGGVVCLLERLRGVRELEPALWRIYPEAGVTTRHVQRLARENGLLFAPDPGASEQSQIGGNVATNAGGPHALKYGVTGAWVAGLEAVIAPGELVALGGWTRKDVAGYDLKSLLIGSEGTLGVITAVRLRLLPAPEAAIVLVAFLRTRAEGCAAMLDILAAGIQPSALDFLDGATLEIVAHGYPGAGAEAPTGHERVPAGAGFALICEVDGTRSEAEAQRRALLEVLTGTAGAAVAIHEPVERLRIVALARWLQRSGHSGAGRQGFRGRGVPSRASGTGPAAVRRDRGAARVALVRVGAWGRGERARHRAGRSRPRGGAGRGAGRRRGAVCARHLPRRVDRRRARRRLAQARPAGIAVGRTGG